MAGVTDPDRCPGVLRPHLAADGAMVRIRVPGGQTTGTALGQLSRIAQRFGSGDLQLTSRASLQLRGLADPVPDSLIRAVREAGFLPSETHERVRNIVASPLTGISGGMTDVRPLVATLDARLCAHPRLASLPSRFLFAVDDGRGDVSATKFDLGYRAIDHDCGWLLVGELSAGGAGFGGCCRRDVAGPCPPFPGGRSRSWPCLACPRSCELGDDRPWHTRDRLARRHDWYPSRCDRRGRLRPGAAGIADASSSGNSRDLRNWARRDHTIARARTAWRCKPPT